MHISEGILSAPVLAAGAGAAFIGIAVGVRKMDYEKIPRVAVLSSAFFVSSLIHIPIGPASAHLILNGINGLLLGWLSFPSIFIALTLQAILFQYGGITTLGINTLNMALPALACYWIFHHRVRGGNALVSSCASFLCGFLAVFFSCVLVALSLMATDESFMTVAKLIVAAHLPVMVIEGLITLFCVAFIKRVKPEMLGGLHDAKE